jgi:AcrR family transcriptional regulator
VAFDTVYKPKQARSQETQDNLLKALNQLLKKKYFEHISIAELAEKAGVSVGTYYRRFRNKEALLPLLYEDFGEKLRAWIGKLEKTRPGSLKGSIHMVVVQLYLFLRRQEGVLRTLHLNSRLHTEVLPYSQVKSRYAEYHRLAELLLVYSNEIKRDNKEDAAEMATFMLVGGLIEKVLYAEQTPALGTKLEGEALLKEIELMVFAYLSIEDQ